MHIYLMRRGNIDNVKLGCNIDYTGVVMLSTSRNGAENGQDARASVATANSASVTNAEGYDHGQTGCMGVGESDQRTASYKVLSEATAYLKTLIPEGRWLAREPRIEFISEEGIAGSFKQGSDLPQVTEKSEVHAPEHSLEVQVPFLQQTLEDFKLIPLAVGNAASEDVHEVIEALWGGPETLIVVSSDLSHYLPYPQAQTEDAATAEKISNLDEPFSPLTHGRACGATPINGLLLAAREHRLLSHVLDLRNSGDTAGDRDRVVGYGSFAFTERT